MATEFALSIVAPDKSVTETTAVSVVIPGSEGYFGVMAGHVPLVAAMKPGLLEYTNGGNERHHVYVGGGFVEVTGARVTVLADEADVAGEVDLAHAEYMLAEARKALRGESSTVPSQNASQELEKAMNRIRAARTMR